MFDDDKRVAKAGPQEAIFKFQILKKNEDGFLLVVTNPRIKSAHDATQANRALSETVALDTAIEMALETMGDKLDETLVIVTADHSNTMTISGYPTRAADIAGSGCCLPLNYLGKIQKDKPFSFVNIY